MRQSINHRVQCKIAIPAIIANDEIPIFAAAPVAVAGATLELDVPVRLDERDDAFCVVELGVLVEFDATPLVATDDVPAAPTSTRPVDAALTTCPFTVAASPPCERVVLPITIALAPDTEEAVIVTLPAARTWSPLLPAPGSALFAPPGCTTTTPLVAALSTSPLERVASCPAATVEVPEMTKPPSPLEMAAAVSVWLSPKGIRAAGVGASAGAAEGLGAKRIVLPTAGTAAACGCAGGSGLASCGDVGSLF